MKGERNIWKEEEIRALLDIIKERNVLDMVEEKTYPSEQIFRIVEKEMRSRGFIKKNHQQIWTKWKFLKSSYVTTRRHNSYQKNVPRKCDYYELLDGILNAHVTTLSKNKLKGTDKTKNSIEVKENTKLASISDLVKDIKENKERAGGEPNTEEIRNEISSLSPETTTTITCVPIISLVQGGFDFADFPAEIKQEVLDESSFEADGYASQQIDGSTFLPIKRCSSDQFLHHNNETYQDENNHNQGRKVSRKRKAIKKEMPELFRSETSNSEIRKMLTGKIEAPTACTTDNSSNSTNRMKRSKISGSYFHAIKEFASDLQQMQRELMNEFFEKQEKMIREEHEFQKQQDEILLKSFEEQTRLLLEGARSLLISNVSCTPDVVFLNED